MSDAEFQRLEAARSKADETADIRCDATDIEDVESSSSTETTADTITVDRERLATLEETIERHEQELAAKDEQIQALQETVKDLTTDLQHICQRVEGVEGIVTGDQQGVTKLQRYARLHEDDRADILSQSEQRAVKLYEHWDEIAWGPNNHGEHFVDTKTKANAKHNPSKLKYRINRELDEELSWTQLYRAMKAVATLSGGEPERDEYDRLSIVGGTFEYEERPVADNSDVRKVLKEVR